MKAPLMFTAGVLLGISVGFIVWKGGGQARGSDQAENGKVTARQPSGRPAPRSRSGADEVLAEYLKGKSPAEMNADEVYEVIAPQMTEYMMGWTEDSVDRARNIYQLELLASKLPPDVMVKVMEMGREKGANQYILRQWFGAYVNRYPEQAMAWASRQPNAKEWRGETILRLANTDPELAIKLYDEEILDGTSPKAVQDVPYRLAQEYGKQGSAAVFRLLDSLPADAGTQVLYRGWDMLPDEERPAFLAELRKRASAGQTEAQLVLNGLILARAESHPEEFREWMANVSPEERASTSLRLATRQLASGKTDAARESLRAAMNSYPGGQKAYAVDMVNSLYMTSPDLLNTMMELLPEDQKPTLQDARKWNSRPAETPAGILDMAALIGPPQDKAEYVADAFTRLADHGFGDANAKDFEIVSHRLEAMQLTGEHAERAKAALERAREKSLGKK